MTASEERRRLAQLMDDRRAALDLRWEDVAEEAGVTTETLRVIRSTDTKMRALTKAGIERALDWEHGSINAVLAGGDPVEAPDDTSRRPPPVDLEQETSHIRHALEVVEDFLLKGGDPRAAELFAEIFLRRQEQVDEVRRIADDDPEVGEIIHSGLSPTEKYERLARLATKRQDPSLGMGKNRRTPELDSDLPMAAREESIETQDERTERAQE